MNRFCKTCGQFKHFLEFQNVGNGTIAYRRRTCNDCVKLASKHYKDLRKRELRKIKDPFIRKRPEVRDNTHFLWSDTI